MLVLDAEASDGAGTPDAPVARAADDLAVLLFTAGTAGPPKAAMLTHGSLLANLEQMQGHPGLRVDADDVALGVLPFFHVFGLNVVLGLGVARGRVPCRSSTTSIRPRRSRACARDGVTVIAAVPAVYAAWVALDADDAPADAFASVRLCVSGAAALAPRRRDAMRARFGVGVHEGYGLTEASPVVTTSAVAAEPRAGSIGPPLPGVEVRLVDADGHDVLEGDPGEVARARPERVRGLLGRRRRDGTRAHDDGWLHTGDIARRRRRRLAHARRAGQGRHHRLGVQRVSRARSRRRSPTHPDVARGRGDRRAAPAHRRDRRRVRRADAGRDDPDPVELLRHAGRRLARYKLPTRVEVVAELPRSFAGKLLRTR